MTKRAVLKAHRPENSFDGYDPHHHWMLLDMSAAEYLRTVLGDNIYPSTSQAEKVLDPYSLPWIKEHVRTVGYGFRQLVGREHYGYYALGKYGEIHDGVDGPVMAGGPGTFVQVVSSRLNNARGYKRSGELYEVEVEDLADEKRYQTVAEVPAYAQPTIKWLIDKGTLTGNAKGLDITEDMIRSWVVTFNTLAKLQLK